jgi:hypothetical protein
VQCLGRKENKAGLGKRIKKIYSELIIQSLSLLTGTVALLNCNAVFFHQVMKIATL